MFFMLLLFKFDDVKVVIYFRFRIGIEKYYKMKDVIENSYVIRFIDSMDLNIDFIYKCSTWNVSG